MNKMFYRVFLTYFQNKGTLLGLIVFCILFPLVYSTGSLFLIYFILLVNGTSIFKTHLIEQYSNPRSHLLPFFHITHLGAAVAWIISFTIFLSIILLKTNQSFLGAISVAITAMIFSFLLGGAAFLVVLGFLISEKIKEPIVFVLNNILAGKSPVLCLIMICLSVLAIALFILRTKKINEESAVYLLHQIQKTKTNQSSAFSNYFINKKLDVLDAPIQHTFWARAKHLQLPFDSPSWFIYPLIFGFLFFLAHIPNKLFYIESQELMEFAVIISSTLYSLFSLLIGVTFKPELTRQLILPFARKQLIKTQLITRLLTLLKHWSAFIICFLIINTFGTKILLLFGVTNLNHWSSFSILKNLLVLSSLQLLVFGLSFWASATFDVMSAGFKSLAGTCIVLLPFFFSIAFFYSLSVQCFMAILVFLLGIGMNWVAYRKWCEVDLE